MRLSAPLSKVPAAKWQRAALLLCEMGRLDPLVSSEGYRQNEERIAVVFATWSVPGTAYTAMIAKEPGAWTREDAMTASAGLAMHVVPWAVGHTRVTVPGELSSGDFFTQYLALCPYAPIDRYMRLDAGRAAVSDTSIVFPPQVHVPERGAGFHIRVLPPAGAAVLGSDTVGR